MWQPHPPHPSSYQAPTTVGYLRFLYVSSSTVKTPLSSQVGNLVLIDAFNVVSRVLSIVFFLRASCCFKLKKRLALSRLQMQGNHGTVSTSSRREGTSGTKNSVASVLHIYKWSSTQQHLKSSHTCRRLVRLHTRWFQGEKKYRSRPCHRMCC